MWLHRSWASVEQAKAPSNLHQQCNQKKGVLSKAKEFSKVHFFSILINLTNHWNEKAAAVEAGSPRIKRKWIVNRLEIAECTYGGPTQYWCNQEYESKGLVTKALIILWILSLWIILLIYILSFLNLIHLELEIVFLFIHFPISVNLTIWLFNDCLTCTPVFSLI